MPGIALDHTTAHTHSLARQHFCLGLRSKMNALAYLPCPLATLFIRYFGLGFGFGLG